MSTPLLKRSVSFSTRMAQTVSVSSNVSAVASALLNAYVAYTRLFNGQSMEEQALSVNRNAKRYTIFFISSESLLLSDSRYGFVMNG